MWGFPTAAPLAEIPHHCDRVDPSRPEQRAAFLLAHLDSPLEGAPELMSRVAQFRVLSPLTNRCYGFYTADGSPLAPTIREQIYALGAPETVPETAFEAYRSFVSSRPAAALTELLEAPTGMVSEKIKSSVTMLTFVSQSETCSSSVPR